MERLLVDLLHEDACAVEVGENDLSIIEQIELIQAVTVACLVWHKKFHTHLSVHPHLYFPTNNQVLASEPESSSFKITGGVELSSRLSVFSAIDVIIWRSRYGS